MLAARSIIYPDPAGGGASGIYMVSLLERLDIAGEMKPKTKLSPSAKVLYASVASGDVEIGFNQISEVLAQPTVEFAGLLPTAVRRARNRRPHRAFQPSRYRSDRPTVPLCLPIACLQRHHAHPEHGLVADIDVIGSREGQLAVVADAEHRQTRLYCLDRFAV